MFIKTKPTIYLVRPDGYVAWRGEAKALNSLLAYVQQWFPVPGTHPQSGQAPEVSASDKG